MLKPKELEIEIRDVLMALFNNTPSIVEHECFSVNNINTTDEGTAPSFNYQRDEVAWRGKKRIDFKAMKLAVIQVKPHKKVTVYSFYDENRYVQKLFERVVETYLPEVRLETVDNE